MRAKEGFARRLFTCVFGLLLFVETGVYAQDPAPDLEVFVLTGCPHCEAAKAFLDDLQQERPAVHIVIHDVARDSVSRQRLSTLAAEQGLTNIGVPAFLIGTELTIGFRSADTTGTELLARLDRQSAGAGSHRPAESIDTRWFGEISVRRLGLPLFTVVIGLLDGFNPCAMWVLLFLLSLLVNLHDRRRMAVIAGTFVFVSGLLYFTFMAAWLNLFFLIGLSRAVQIALGGIAVLAGAVNVKDFFALHQGISLSIPESAKPGIYARIRGILQAEHLGTALGGIVILAALVNVIELLCTAGFPALYTHILTLQQMPAWDYYGYLGLYNLAYIFDDSVMGTIAVITLSRRKLQERTGRWLKLAGGTVMMGLGFVLLLKPDWLVS